MFIFLNTGKHSPCKRDPRLALPYRGARTYNSTQRRRSRQEFNLSTKEIALK